MGHQSQPRRLHLLTGASLAAGLLLATPAMAGPADTYYERSLMSAANARCDLFTNPVARALNAGAAQARSAALRSGVNARLLNETRARARVRAAQTPCDSRDLSTAAERVRRGFSAWARTARMTFPDRAGAWVVDRSAYAQPTWMMRQDAGQGTRMVTFGYAGNRNGQGLVTVARGEGRQRPVSARLLVRNPERARTPWVPRAGISATPPRSAMQVIVANYQARPEITMAADSLAGAVMFRFPSRAGRALAQLDPRERFIVELVHADGSTRQVEMAVGDFIAARAFLAMGTL